MKIFIVDPQSEIIFQNLKYKVSSVVDISRGIMYKFNININYIDIWYVSNI